MIIPDGQWEYTTWHSAFLTQVGCVWSAGGSNSFVKNLHMCFYSHSRLFSNSSFRSSLIKRNFSLSVFVFALPLHLENYEALVKVCFLWSIILSQFSESLLALLDVCLALQKNFSFRIKQFIARCKVQV